MVNADEWSLALYEWATMDRAPGSIIYLSVDEHALTEIGRAWWGLDNGFEHFIESLKEVLRVPMTSGWESAPWLELPDGKPLKHGVPNSVSFLAFLVVCAGRNGERMPDYEGEDTQQFFFPWVKKLLGGKPTRGRDGLGALSRSYAPEVGLWQGWARFLEKADFVRVPDTRYSGTMKNWGYALDQAILTAGDRNTLRRLNPLQRHSLLKKLRSREIGRIIDFGLPHATMHLREMLSNRWGEASVQEAVLGALEGAPFGPRPSQGAFRVIRRSVGKYFIKIEPPSRWDTKGLQIVVNGHMVSREIPVSRDIRTLTVQFRNGDAQQEVKWEAPAFYRFLDSGSLLTAAESDVPEIYEEHFLLVPAECLCEIEALRNQKLCDWRSGVGCGGWIELQRFCLYASDLHLSCGKLVVKNHGGVIFEGGIRSGETGRVVRLFEAKRGGFRSAGSIGDATIEGTDIQLELGPDRVVPIPALPCGEYKLMLKNQMTRFELVDWRKVIYEETPVPEWAT